MSSSESLTEEQVASLRRWAEDGDALADIQRKLAEKCGRKLTYLETRFLLEDLAIELKAPPEPEPEPEPESVDGGEEAEAAPGEAGAEGGVRVTVDQVQRPGALISGKVVFSGGQSALWWLDEMGRLGYDPEDQQFRPDESEMLAFQRELQKVVRGGGF